MDESKLIEFVRNKNKIEQLTERNEEILAEEGLRAADYGTYTIGERIVVEVSRNARFDAKLATELFPLGVNGENIELYAAEVSSTLAKKHLAPVDYERCQKVFPKHKVEVKLI